jgi:integrase
MSTRRKRAAPEPSQLGEQADDLAPEYVWSKYGLRVDTRQAKWRLDGRRSINIEGLRALVSVELLEGLNATLRACVANQMSHATVDKLQRSLRHYHRTMHAPSQIERWTSVEFKRYRRKLTDEFSHEEYLISIRAFLKLWAALRQPGIQRKVTDSLAEMRLKASKSGRAVTSLDPEVGPFTPEELQAVTADLYRASAAGRTSIEDTSLLIFHVVTGRRPEQSANLKCSDIDRRRQGEPEFGGTGHASRIIAVPRSKGKGEGFRASLRGVHAEDAFFALMEAQKGCVQAQFRELLSGLPIELQQQDLEHLLDNIPLYPQWSSVTASVDEAGRLIACGQIGRAVAGLRNQATLPVWHLRSQYITRRLQQVVTSIGTKSRTGQPLNVTAYRFRYTKGTELARLGIGLDVLAWLMDHSTLQSARVYIANVPEHGAQIDDALKNSSVLRGVAVAFTPSLVECDDPAESDDVRRATEVRYKGKRVLKCGIQKSCGMGGGIPLACYTCNNFRPWVDGPHEEVLADLLRERAADGKVLGVTSSVTRRRDTTIVAVIVTIRRCQEWRDRHARAGGAE